MEKKNTHTNDNEDTWQPLSLATGRLLQRYEKQNEEDGGESDHAGTEKQRTPDQKQYVDQRLRDLAEFERRASGIKKRKV